MNKHQKHRTEMSGSDFQHSTICPQNSTRKPLNRNLDYEFNLNNNNQVQSPKLLLKRPSDYATNNISMVSGVSYSHNLNNQDSITVRNMESKWKSQCLYLQEYVWQLEQQLQEFQQGQEEAKLLKRDNDILKGKIGQLQKEIDICREEREKQKQKVVQLEEKYKRELREMKQDQGKSMRQVSEQQEYNNNDKIEYLENKLRESQSLNMMLGGELERLNSIIQKYEESSKREGVDEIQVWKDRFLKVKHEYNAIQEQLIMKDGQIAQMKRQMNLD